MACNVARIGDNKWNKIAFTSIVICVFIVCLLYSEVGDFVGVNHIQTLFYNRPNATDESSVLLYQQYVANDSTIQVCGILMY